MYGLRANSCFAMLFTGRRRRILFGLLGGAKKILARNFLTKNRHHLERVVGLIESLFQFANSVLTHAAVGDDLLDGSREFSILRLERIAGAELFSTKPLQDDRLVACRGRRGE